MKLTKKTLIKGDAVLSKFSKKGHLRSLENKRSKLVPCYFCPYLSRYKSTVTRHERTHTGERPFKCDICELAFNAKSNMKVHSKTHEKNHNNSDGKEQTRFTETERTNAKNNESNGDSDDKPYECAICQSTFPEKQDLLLHKKNHAKDGQFECYFCS